MPSPKREPADRHDVTVKNVHPAALAHALRIADGDRSRLRFHDDGTVTVENAARVARRPTR
ncbi:hypothetical protein [Cellulosimicrobium sp. TH-20]|uniref:hypothetical protein n=1 Tax=Cellulosimicrobium sp. TH-20 TaxID=1980001 RepID=UPI0012FB0939|nr:hypothetical protein [Cellulosimicrobium sp. TH-20]